MAKATKVNRVNLELSQDEAFCLSALLNHIGGGPCGPRKHINKIKLALEHQIDEDADHPPIAFEAVGRDSLYIN